MADLTLAQIQALLADNTTGDISAADVRDVSTALYERTDGTNPIEGLTFDTTAPAPAPAAGVVHWNSSEGTLDIDTSATSAIQVGYESRINVRNNSGATILNGRPVRITGSVGNLPTIALDDGQGTICAVSTDDIPNNTNGNVTVLGLVRDLNTAAFAAGSTVYSSAAGALTGTPSASTVGTVLDSHASTGAILVRPFRTLGAVGTTAQRTTVRPTGFAYFDTTLGIPVFWNGAAWVNASGGVV
jgi:hypothetical protein